MYIPSALYFDTRMSEGFVAIGKPLHFVIHTDRLQHPRKRIHDVYNGELVLPDRRIVRTVDQWVELRIWWTTRKHGKDPIGEDIVQPIPVRTCCI